MHVLLVRITLGQYKRIRAEAQKLGCSMTEVIRRLLDRNLP